MALVDKLQSTRLEYLFEDASGYKFKVVCEKEVSTDPYGQKYDRGWRASLTMTSAGLISPEAAVESLIDDAKQFIRQASKK